MVQKLKQPLIMGFIVFFIAMMLLVFFLPQEKDIAEDPGYTINLFDVEAVVHEDGTIEMTEKIIVTFHEESHGIYRYIPLKGDIKVEEDGKNKVKKLNIKVKDIKSNKYGRKYTEGGNQVIQLGEENRYEPLNTPVYYEIAYTILLPVDNNKEYDLFYLNLLPADQKATVEALNFKVTMPSVIDEEKLTIYSGDYSQSGNEYADYTVNGNVLSGSFNQVAPGESVLTVLMRLENGYFVKPLVALYKVLMWVVVTLIPVLVFIFWLLFGRSDDIVKTVEFEPPKGLTSADLGLIIDGKSDNNDILSLIIYWAEKGWITIHDLGGKDVELRRLKNLPEGSKAYEKTLFTGLFGRGDSVKLSSLEGKFSGILMRAKSQLANEFAQGEKQLVTSASKSLANLSFGLLLLPILFVCLLGSMMTYSFSLMIGLASVMVVGAAMFIFDDAHKRRFTQKGKTGYIVGVLMVLGIYALLAYLSYGTLLLPYIIVGGILNAAGLVFAASIGKRTPKGTEWMGQILGFRDFIEKAEKDKLEKLVEEDPQYFYRVLPYAYALGVSDKWSKKFESLAVPEPSWYYGGSTMRMFNTLVFIRLLNSSMTTMTRVTTPKSRGGGSFGGGKSFGGGFGGGGGVGGGGMGRW